MPHYVVNVLKLGKAACGKTTIKSHLLGDEHQRQCS